jgi:tetratricopeptide (TPR) repeat protein
LSDSSVKTAALQGTLDERPFPHLLQQLYRKQFTGCCVIADQTRDESEIYLRKGSPVHVRRPRDTDHLDSALVEYQSQLLRKLTQLFFIVDGTYAIYLTPHSYGEDDKLPLMRVDPRSVIYPGIRAAYDLPRVTRELSRLLGQRFRLTALSPGFTTAMGMAPEDATVAALCKGWMTLDDLDAIAARPLEVRVVALALYYSDLLEREPVRQPATDSAIPGLAQQPESSGMERALAPSLPTTVGKVAATPRHGQTLSPEAIRASIQDMAQKIGHVTHFELLGVSQNATSDEVSTAFVRAARQFHPDRLISTGLLDLQPTAEKILARINEAAMILSDTTRRAEYVASLSDGAAVHANLPTVLEAENTFLKGEVFLKKGEHAKAIESFAAASQANPSEPQYRAYLAWARFDDPRARKEVLVRETLKTLEEVVSERPKFVRGFYWIGLLWKFLNEPSKAEKAFREVVTLDASFIEASRELRLIDMRKSKPAGNKPAAKTQPPRNAGLMGKLFKK